MSELQATTTPWKLKAGQNPKVIIEKADGSEDVCQCLLQGDAELIVKSVNSHDEVLKALQNLVNRIENFQGLSFWRAEFNDKDNEDMLKEAYTAINNAS